MQDALEVDIDQQVIVFGRSRLEQATARNAGIVEQDIEPAARRIPEFGQRRFPLPAVPHVHDIACGLPLRQKRCGFGKARLVDIGKADKPPAPGKEPGCRPSNARTTARDENRLAHDHETDLLASIAIRN